MTQFNDVTRPQHYTVVARIPSPRISREKAGDAVPYQEVELECRDVIDALDLPVWVAFALKYIWRHRRKGGPEASVQDLLKAKQCLEYAVDRIRQKEVP